MKREYLPDAPRATAMDAMDAGMPMLRRALDPDGMAGCLGALLGRPGWQPELVEIRLRRHKPGRRCLIEYELRWPDGTTFGVLGKIRAKGLDRRSHAVQETLRGLGFVPDGPLGVAVPRTLGLVPELSMWLQEKVAGSEVLPALTGPQGERVARRIAAAVQALHTMGPPPDRRHDLVDELRILDRQLTIVAEARPEWGERLERVLAACLHLAASSDRPVWRASHRDFYHDNLLWTGSCLYLLDLDLYCEADQGLDIGNFIAHLTEHALRELGDERALAHIEQELEQAFLRLAGAECGPAVRLYTTLTLVRHIAISSRITQRQWCVPALLNLCEQRLEIAS